ncbi:MAG TPA: carboxypeptidase-like regulatory domain-containing protein [Gemmatimonadaceae bacterium]|jgi:hypothetical protein|nr:carboxypeptidase-like regulatory domain-containing protein [Gemmatimonadaceae bacterium]
MANWCIGPTSPSAAITMSQSWPLDLRTAKATKLSLILVTAVALGAAPAARAGAQETGRHTAGTTVSGIVYDSLSGKPLAGALVQIARKGNDSPALSAQSGADGAYAIADVPPGSYIIGFFPAPIRSVSE